MKQLRFGLVMAALVLGACASADADPAEVIEEYRVAYNAGDVDAVMALFSEESVVTGHPFEAQLTGLAAIRAVQLEDLAAAATENALTISNVEVTDNTVKWDHVWIRQDGNRFCKQGHAAVVEDGKITSWAWPGGGFDCP